jgi:alpha-L-rhamnosidase
MHRCISNWQVCKDGKLAIHIEIPFDCEAVVCLPESDEKKLTAGVYDFLLETKRDYRKIYSMESTLDDMTEDTRAMDILKDYLPVAFNMACSDNLENLSMTLNDLRNQPWFGCRPDQVDSAAAKLLELNAMIE